MEEDTLQDVDTVYHVQQTWSLADPPYEIALKVDGHPVKFELNLGAPSNLIHESAILKFPTLNPAHVSFTSVIGHKMHAWGIFMAEGDHDDEVYQMFSKESQ